MSDSCYQLTGFHQPKISKVLRLAGEGGPAQIFAGQYAGPTWQASPPAGSSWEGFRSELRLLYRGGPR